MADRVRAKFYCYSVSETVHGGSVDLRAVCRGEDNKKWASATPSGQITMTINNELALEFYRPGLEYFVDFVVAPKDQEGMGE